MNNLQLEEYDLFEFGKKEYIMENSELDANKIPPFTMFSVYIKLPVEPVQINHFTSKDRDFFKSERKFNYLKLTHVTCMKMYLYLAVGIVWYMSLVFLLYIIVTNWQRPRLKKNQNAKPSKGSKGS